jgi:hypothetical protein
MGNGVKQGPMVEGGRGTITVTGHGTNGEAVMILLYKGGASAGSHGGFLDGAQDSYQFTGLAAGTYDVKVIAPYPGGTTYDFPDIAVTS